MAPEDASKNTSTLFAVPTPSMRVNSPLAEYDSVRGQGICTLLSHHLGAVGPIMIPVGVLTMNSDMNDYCTQPHKNVPY